jgi:hypothetical protein
MERCDSTRSASSNALPYQLDHFAWRSLRIFWRFGSMKESFPSLTLTGDWAMRKEAVLSVCSNLISVVDVNGSQIVQFSHFSVKEFLTSNRLATAMEDLSGYHIVPRSAHTILAQASLSVLLQLDDHIDKTALRTFHSPVTLPNTGSSMASSRAYHCHSSCHGTPFQSRQAALRQLGLDIRHG